MTKAKKGAAAAAGSKAKAKAVPVAPASVLAGIGWIRLATGAVIGVLAALFVGVMPLYGPWAIRALACGLVVGLSVRSWRDLPVAAGLAALAAVVATPLASIVQTQTESAAPAASDYVLAIVVCAAVAALVGLVCASGRVRFAALVAVTVLVALQLFQAGFLPGTPRDATAQLRARVATEPAAEQYAFDGDMFIKIDHLAARGVPYYQAFMTAFEEDQRISAPPAGLFNVRQRWIYDLWRVLPGGPGLRVLYGFQLLMAATMIAGYALARRFVEPAAALLAPVAIGGYLLMPAVTIWFPLSEYWAGMVAVFFLYALVTERWTWAGVLAVVAFAFRELMLFLAPVYVVWWLVSKRRREGVAGLVLTLAGPVVLLGLHAMWSPVSAQSAQGVAHWLQGGFDKLLAVLHFSGALVRSSDWLYLAVPALALAGALMTRTTWTRVLLATAVVVPVTALTVFSGGLWNDYWGAIAMPMLLSLVPLAAGAIVPSAQARLDARPAARGGAGSYQVGPRGGDPAVRAAFEERAKAAWEAGADVVVGSRLAPGAKVDGPTGARVAAWVGARVLSSLCRCLCPVPGLRDVAPQLALVDAGVLRAAPDAVRSGLVSAGPSSPDFLLWARDHARVREVPLESSSAPALPWRLIPGLAVARLRELATAL